MLKPNDPKPGDKFIVRELTLAEVLGTHLPQKHDYFKTDEIVELLEIGTSTNGGYFLSEKTGKVHHAAWKRLELITYTTFFQTLNLISWP